MPDSDSSSNLKSWLKIISACFNNFFSKKIKTRSELLNILKTASSNKILSQEALTMIEGVLQVTDMQARDIMIPRSQMVVFELDAKLEEFLPQMIESGHSRFPVIGDSRDEILGTIMAKDLLPYILNRDKKINLQELLRPAMVIPESKRLNILLKEFRITRHHMAIIADEYGGISGLATIEDVLEQIVGNIEDEFDAEEESNIIKLNDDSYHVQALTPIIEFNQHFNADFSDEEFDTIGGVVLNSFGHLPTKNESIIVNGFKVKILNADRRRIKLLKINKIKEKNNTIDSTPNVQEEEEE